MAVVTRYVNTDSTPGGDGTTNNTTGSNRAYASLSEWESNEQTDLVSDGDSHICLVDGTGGNDTTGVTLAGWTTSATNDVTIRATGDQRCDGLSRDKTAAGYKLKATDEDALDIRIDHLTIDGFEIELVDNGSVVAFALVASTSSEVLSVSDMLISCAGAPLITPIYAVDIQTTTSCEIENTLVIAQDRRGLRTTLATGTVTIDHCGVYGDSDRGIDADDETTITNTWVFSGNPDFSEVGDDPAGSNNASSDTTATALFSSSLASLVAANQFAAPSATLSTADFRLIAGADLINAGTGSEATDISGETRVTQDIGPFQRLAAFGAAEADVSTASGSATRFHVAEGALESDTVTVSGSASRVVTASGTVSAQASTVVGSAFAGTAGRLLSQPSTVSGSAEISAIHATGVLVAQASRLGVIPAAPNGRTVSVLAEIRSITVSPG